MATLAQEENGFLKSNFPVFIPADPLLTSDHTKFESFLRGVDKFTMVAPKNAPTEQGETGAAESETDESVTLISAPSVSTAAEVRAGMEDMELEPAPEQDEGTKHEQPFMKALHSTSEPPENTENLMRTENADLAHRSTTEPLLDLFAELEEVISGPRLRELLDAAWKQDPLSTLKIIFNARSIHIGKSSRPVTYKCFGWLAANHPVTLLLNLQWLARPIIEKKMGEKDGEKKGEDEMVMVEAEKDENDPTRFDVKDGVAHGYWKDLLNILALAANGKLDVLANPRDLLNIQKKGKKSEYEWDQEKAKKIRTETKTARHATAVKLFEESSFYRALHLTVARLFAEQLKSDLALLRSNDKKAARQISLCAKWAPTMGLFHDKHTFVASSIAEILHPQSEFSDTQDRELYLRHAREAYRKDVSALRKSLEVVERDIAAENFANIKYERVPSLAMSRYTGLFAKKDYEHFDQYLNQVIEGSKTISGAVLLPSKLVSTVRASSSIYNYRPQAKGFKAKIEEKKQAIDAKVADEQWKTLVKRIKDSGKLENSIAVCDVSGSMGYPTFPDGTCPMDSAIGLSLLLAEVTAPPFGGTFITFSEVPTVEEVKGSGLREKIQNMEQSNWGMNTDVVAVFEKLILPVAKKHKVKQEDMVKQVFIFSDMQFDAGCSPDAWTSSYDRIKREYVNAGYEMPNLVFWNLAGGRAGVTEVGDPVAPKPVTAADEGTSLVSGYSQGMLKVFLDNGAFEDPEAEEEIVETVTGEDEEEVVEVRKKQKMDPMSTLRKAISHKSYSMLKVVD